MDPFKYINSLSMFGTEAGYKPGLERIRKLLKYLGNPQRDLDVIHIAGTNGKGSTAAILERIYREAGYKTALYSSPHFFHFNERIKINGRSCSTYELEEITAEVKFAAEKLKEQTGVEASFFEIVTVIAFKYFKQHDPEIVILETGLGGRLDATNIVKKPLLSLITNISLEHREFLGDTIAEIATEKAGIIKENSKVITAVEQIEALSVIQNKAQAKNSKFIALSKEYDLIKSSGNLRDNIIHLKRKEQSIAEYRLSLLGEHQAVNTALALRSVEELSDSYQVNKNEIRRALADIYWPGRMEKIYENPLIILDGAHNPAAFRELLKNINNSKSEYKDLHFVFSVLKDKDLAAILTEFINYNLSPKFYLAENNSFRTIKIEDLAVQVKSKKFEYQIYNNLSDASLAAFENADKADLIVAAGSFNTVFEAGVEFMSNNIRGGENE